MAEPVTDSGRWIHISTEKEVLYNVQGKQLEKWGWVIYRTSYEEGTEEKWKLFKEFTTRLEHEKLAKSDAPEIADTLEWKFVEDKETLNGATTEQLRDRFKAWVADAVKIEHPREDTSFHGFEPEPRYHYFVQMDDAALQSVGIFVNKRGVTKLYGAVKFISAFWQPEIDDVQDDVDEEEEEDAHLRDPEETYEAIDGCTQYDVGFMLIGVNMMSMEFYRMMATMNAWSHYYKRPPQGADF